MRGDGKYMGMIFVGKPTKKKIKNIMKNIAPVLFITLIAMLLVGMVSVSEAKKLAEVINKEKDFLGEISKGNLRATLDAGILARKDELGEMGQFTIRVQKFIRDMIERPVDEAVYQKNWRCQAQIYQTGIYRVRCSFLHCNGRYRFLQEVQ